MNRQEALREVASNVAGLLRAGSLEEATSIDQSELDEMSEANRARIEWALDEVARRLYEMGQPRTRRSVPSGRTRVMSKIVRDPREGGTGEWADAFRRVSADITAHPDFPRLVREVAIAEQSGHPRTSWLRRNSLTYAAWADRGMPHVDTGPGRKRARTLAWQIGEAIGLMPELPQGERIARVYVEALDHVRARLTGSSTERDGNGDQ